jgi:hypothetical protein
MSGLSMVIDPEYGIIIRVAVNPYVDSESKLIEAGIMVRVFLLL